MNEICKNRMIKLTFHRSTYVFRQITYGVKS